MTKGIIAIREVKSNQTMLSLEDYNVRANAEKFAADYLQDKWDQEGQATRWMWYAGYFVLGCFFWETLPLMIGLITFFINL
jgi:hypothetical protein